MRPEDLSALLDGECGAAEADRLLAELAASPEARAQWSRLCLAREAAAGTRIGKDQRCICEGVMAGLDAAPSGKVVPLPAPRRTYSAMQAWGGYAAAAAVAAVAVLVAMPARKQDSAAPLPPATVTAVAAPAPASLVATAAKPAPHNARAPRNVMVALPSDQRQELESMLMEHSNSMSEQGMGRTLRYARFAAHTADYRPGQELVQDAAWQESGDGR